MKKIFFVFIFVLDLSVAKAQGTSAFDSESKSVARPNISVEKADYEALSKGLKTGSDEVVVDRASRILAKDPDDVKALNALAAHYIRTKKFGMAKLILNRALEKHPDEAALHNNMGVVYLAEGEVPLALQSFKKSLAGGNSKMGALNLSSLLLKHRDYSRALGALEDAYDKVRSEIGQGQQAAIDLANNYGVALMGTGEPNKAKDVFDKIIDTGSRDPEVHLNMAILYVDILGDKKNGQRTLSKLQFMTEDKSILKQVEELESRAK